MEKLKTKPSLLQLTKTLRRKEETRPSKFYFNHTGIRVVEKGSWKEREVGKSKIGKSEVGKFG